LKNRTDGDVLPFRRSSELTSEVLPVARKVSGAETVSPIAARVRIIKDLTEAVLAAYTAAADARAAGDGERAKLLEQRAESALAMAHETALEIAAL